MSPRARIILWSPVALLVAFEFYLSAQSRLPNFPGMAIPQIDKLGHAAYFFLTAACAARAARFGEKWNPARTRLTILTAALVYGILDEYHQSFIPNRSVDAADVAADFVGALLATLIAEPIWKALKLDHTVR